MTLSIREILAMLYAAAWRRRWVIALPILLFTVLGILLTLIWPRTYSTRALLMLQERQVSDPLSSSGGATREARLRAEEIDMLLKSERVLASAIVTMHVEAKPLSAKDIESSVRSLRRQIGVSVVGSEFIEIELKQSDRNGIGERLSILLTHFFERLLTREDSMQTARQFALEQRRRDVDVARTALEDWLKRATAVAGTPDTGEAAATALKAKYVEAEKQLLQMSASLLPETPTMATIADMLAMELRQSQTRSRGFQNPAQSAGAQLTALRDLETQLDQVVLMSLELERANLSRAKAIATALPRKDAPKSAAAASLVDEWQLLELRYAQALGHLEDHQKRSKKAAAAALTPFGLIAPESIRIIDAPRDPITPMTSALKILLACLVGGVGLGVGLAAILEQLDDRVHDPSEFSRLLPGLSVVRVAQLDADQIPALFDPERPPRRKGHLELVGDQVGGLK